MIERRFVVALVAALVVTTSCGRLRSEPATPASPDTTATGSSVPGSGDEPAPSPPPATSPDTPGLVAGTSHHTLTVDGVERTYRLDVPDPAPPGPVDLVVALHGGLGSGDGFADITGLDTRATERGFVVAFPDGRELRSPLGPRVRTWNAGRCCGSAVREDVDDIAFLDAVVDAVDAAAGVRHLYVTGHSNGAMLAFAYACARASRVAAIAPVAGSLEITGACTPDHGVDLLAIHGDADEHHPLEGGRGPRSVVAVSYRSMAETLEMWARAFDCRTPVAATTSGPLTTSGYDDCRDATSARLVVVAGAGHPWPGGTRPGASRDLDATAAVLDFFTGS